METRDLDTACVIIVSRWLWELYVFIFRLLDISVFTSGHQHVVSVGAVGAEWSQRKKTIQL